VRQILSMKIPLTINTSRASMVKISRPADGTHFSLIWLSRSGPG
jgi:hypothetical protein